MVTEHDVGTWKWGGNSTEADFSSVLVKGISESLAQDMRELLERTIKEQLDILAAGLPGSQRIDGAEVQVQYVVEDGNILFDYKVVGGTVNGTAEVPVRSHSRDNSEISSHTRTMENQAIWKLPNGEFVTLNSIPQALLQEAINKGMQQVMYIIGG